MKKRIIFILMMFPLVAVSQPKKWNKKSMSDFRNDTIAYLKHNFDKANSNTIDYFKGKTIGDIIPELGFKVEYISALGFKSFGGDLVSIMLVSKSMKHMKEGRDYGVMIYIDPTAHPGSEIYKKLYSGELVPFDKDAFKLQSKLHRIHRNSIS